MERKKIIDILGNTFSFEFKKDVLIPPPKMVFRGSDYKGLKIRDCGEATLGKGVYFTEDIEEAQLFGQVKSYLLPNDITICKTENGGIFTIEGGDADDMFVEWICDDHNICIEPESLEEKQTYFDFASVIAEEYSKLGCDGLYREGDTQMVIWNEKILSQMVENGF